MPALTDGGVRVHGFGWSLSGPSVRPRWSLCGLDLMECGLELGHLLGRQLLVGHLERPDHPVDPRGQLPRRKRVNANSE
jgi:hypothetical protein